MFQIHSRTVRNSEADAGQGRVVTFDGNGVAQTEDPWAAGFFAAMPASFGYRVDPIPEGQFLDIDRAPPPEPRFVPPPLPKPASNDVWEDIERRREKFVEESPPRLMPELMAHRILDRYTVEEVAEIVAILAPPPPVVAPVKGDLDAVPEAAPPVLEEKPPAPIIEPPAPAPAPKPVKRDKKD